MPNARSCSAWARDHGIDTNVCFDIEVFDGELTAHCYARNGAGETYLDDEGVLAIAEPIVVGYQAPLPKALQGGGD